MGYAAAVSSEILPGPGVRETPAEYGGPEAEGPGRDSAPSPGDAAPAPDATPDLDALETLSQEITLLSAQIESATQRLLALIDQFDAARGWEWAGYRSCAEWLAYRTGIDKGAARERVRAARALRELPLTQEALARGELTFSKVRALTRVAEPDNEAHLLELARESTASELERMVRGWRMANARDEAERDRIRHRNRCLSVFPDLDGTYVVRGRLTPEVGALLMRAIEAASDVLYSAERTEAEEAKGRRRSRTLSTTEDSEAAASRRRADALALLVEQAMAAGLGGGGLGGPAPDSSISAGDDKPVSNVSAEPRSARRSQTFRATSGTTAERYQVMVHVDLDTLRTPNIHPLDRADEGHRKRARKTRLDRIVEAARASEAEGDPGRPPAGCTHDHSHIDDVRVGPRHARPSSGPSSESHSEPPDQPLGSAATGPIRPDLSHIDDVRIPAETSRRLCCDASVVRVGRGAPGEPLDLGRRTRTISPALRRALELRDRGCRFPGCGSRFTDAHHIRHWADGGETSLRNCILLCRHHHRLVHEGGWTVLPRGEGRPWFADPRGGEHFDGRWKAPVLDPGSIGQLPGSPPA